MSNFIGTLVGTLVGGLVTWWVSGHHYVKASHDLEQAAGRLQKLTTLIIRGIEEAGLATFTRDAAGNPIGLVIHASAHMAGKATVSATLDRVPKGD